MKGSIEAGDLRDIRIMLAERFHELEAGGEMFGVVGAETMQFFDEFASDALSASEFGATVNDAMTDANYAIEAEIFFEPGNDEVAAGAVIGGFNRDFLGSAVLVFDCDGGIRKADPLEFAGNKAGHRGIGDIESEFDAGGTTVDSKDARRWPIHISEASLRHSRGPRFERFPHRANS